MIGGLLFVRYINEIEKFLSKVLHHKVFDDTIYYFNKIPTLVEPLDGGLDRGGRPVDRRRARASGRPSGPPGCTR